MTIGFVIGESKPTMITAQTARSLSVGEYNDDRSDIVLETGAAGDQRQWCDRSGKKQVPHPVQVCTRHRKKTRHIKHPLTETVYSIPTRDLRHRINALFFRYCGRRRHVAEIAENKEPCHSFDTCLRRAMPRDRR